MGWEETTFYFWQTMLTVLQQMHTLRLKENYERLQGQENN